MLLTGTLLSELNFAVLGVPIDDTAHTRLVVHVYDKLIGKLVRHPQALLPTTFRHSKVLLQSWIKANTTKIH
jgi:hypothetical protein